MAQPISQPAGQERRLPPQAIDVERTVLGAALIDMKAAALAIELLQEDAFYVAANRHIFATMRTMFEQDIPIDLVTMADTLTKKGLLQAVGAEPYLSELVNSVATSANIEYYSKILRDKSMLRRLISTSAEITTDCFDEQQEAQMILDRAESSIFDISESRIKSGFIKLGALLPKTFEEIDSYTKGGYIGVPTGFGELDEKTTGFQKGDLIIVAGRPSMGKTAFCLSCALHAAVKAGKAVGVFSLEMSKEQVVQRLLCGEARINMHQLRSGKLPQRDYPKLSLAAGPLAQANLYIDDTPGIGILELRAKCRRLKAQAGLDMVVIDYLQLMSASHNAESRQQEISQISRSLKGLAKELSVPVVALSQLSRAVEMRGGDKRPQLSDLRESGAIEQDADVVMFVYRGEYYEPDNEALRGIAEIIIGKQRNGPIGTAKLAFLRDYARFDNLAYVPEEGGM